MSPLTHHGRLFRNRHRPRQTAPVSPPALERLEDRALLSAGPNLVNPGALSYTAPTGNGADHFTLRLNGGNLELVDDSTSQVVASKGWGPGTSVLVQGADNEDDTLTIDYSFGGYFDLLNGGIGFRGGSGGGNHLALRGASPFTYNAYTTTGPRSGYLVHTSDPTLPGVGASTIRTSTPSRTPSPSPGRPPCCSTPATTPMP